MRILLMMVMFVSNIALSSCTSQNGEYLIYKAATEQDPIIPPLGNLGESNSTINSLLKQAFLGKKYKIEFEKDYTTLTLLNQGKYDNLVLAKELHPSGIVVYFGEYLKGPAKFSIYLVKKQKKEIVLNIFCEIPKNEPLFIPTQLGASLRDYERPIYGEVFLYLNKL